MKKILISLILTLSIIFSGFFALSASAYNINEYEMHHKAGMLISMDTGDVLYEKNADEKVYPASITKLMTALVMVENIADLENTKIPYTLEAHQKILGTGSVVLNLKVGEEITAKDALAALLIPSCGDVAYAIAEYVGGTTESFVDMMNEKAKELGLENTNFTNPVGLHDDELYTTARDIYKLASVAFENENILEVISKSRYTVAATNMSEERTIVTSNFIINMNTNVYYKYAIGGKTGFTDEAGRCLVCLASYGGYNYMSIVMGVENSPGVGNHFIDTANMFRWAFNNFEYKTLFGNTTPVAEAKVTLAKDTDFFTVCFENGLKALLPKDADESTMDYKIHLDKDSFKAPVSKGQKVGTADIYYANEKIGTLNLVAAQNVEASGFKVFMKSIGDFFTSAGVKTVFLVLGLIIGLIIIILIIWIAVLNLGRKKNRKVKYRKLSKKELQELEEDK